MGLFFGYFFFALPAFALAVWLVVKILRWNDHREEKADSKSLNSEI